MSSFEETFKGLLLEFIKRRGVDAVEVTGYDESVDVYSGGGCPSCAYDEKNFEVEIFYVPTDPALRTRWGSNCYTYDGKFSDLLGELIEIGKELDAREAE